MNDDPIAASDPARLPTPLDDDDERDHSDAGSRDEGDDAGEGSSRPQDATRRSRDAHRSARRRSSSKIRRAKAGIAAKINFMAHLMGTLDVSIFAELCIVYYMEYAPSSPTPHTSTAFHNPSVC